MADYTPPPGPPPPKVPEGWKAQWNDQYKEWFYVNTYTKQSQWERPTSPVYGAPPGGAPPGPPPGYDHSSARSSGPEKNLATNNPYGPGGPGSAGSNSHIADDEAFARKLQEEENARARAAGTSSRGTADTYYGGGSSGAPAAPQYGQGAGAAPGYANQELPPRDQDRGKSKGLFGKLFSSSSSSRPQQAYGYPQQQGGYGGYQQGPPQGQYGYAPQAGYYGQGGYPPQQQYYQQQRPKKSGIGAGGGAALGLGAGLLGGMMLENAIDDHEDQAYDQGYDQGYDNGDNGGGDDYGGGDDGGDF